MSPTSTTRTHAVRVYCGREVIRLTLTVLGLLVWTVCARAQEQPAPQPDPPALHEAIPMTSVLRLLGHDVTGKSGEVVAKIANVLVDASGQSRVVILDYGGFLGVGNRRIAVAWRALRFEPGEDSGVITLSMNREQLKNFPAYKSDKPVIAAAPPDDDRLSPENPRYLRAESSGGMTDRRSERGLDWLNFFVADVQTGFGPFIAVYLAGQEWSETDIGFALSVGTFTAMASQVPAGRLVDATPQKRLVALAALVCLAVSAILLAVWPATLPVLVSEVLHGFTSCVLAPAVAAISVALVGQRRTRGAPGPQCSLQGDR